MQAFWRSHRTDLAHIAALLVLAAIPLVFLRGAATFVGQSYYPCIGASVAAWLAVLWAWRRAASVRREPSPAGPPSSFAHGAGVAAALAVLTLVNFYLPLRLHFWGGGDEHIIYAYLPSCFWNENMDVGLCRPLWLLPIGVARLMTPDRMDGFLALAALLCLANGLLLAGIVAHFFRGDWLVPLAAGALLIVNPCDASRFYVIWTSLCYWTALFFLLLAVRLYLASYARDSRLLLAAACAAWTAAGLCHEAAALLGCVAPGLLWLSRRRRAAGPAPLAPWLFAWGAAAALLAGRFAVHLLFDGGQGGYQARVLASAHLTADRVLTNGWTLAAAFASYFRTPSARLLRTYWPPCATAAAAFVVACVLARRRAGAGSAVRPTARRCLLGAAAAALVALAALAPFLPIGWAFRTEFLAGPGQAAFLACAIGAAVAPLPRSARVGGGAALAGWLLVSATACAWDGQDWEQDDNPVSFETVVDVLEHVHGLSPHYTPGTLLFFVVDAPDRSPFGPGYALDFAAYYCMERTLAAQTGPRASFNAEGVRAQDLAVHDEKLYRYDQLVLYRIDRDGCTHLLDTVPAFLVPPGTDASAYAPTARMIPGPVAPLPFFRPLIGGRQPNDVLDYRGGILLGAGWGKLEYADGRLSRQARDGAELLINPASPAARQLAFVVDAAAPTSTDVRQPRAVEALDESGAVAAAGDIGPGGLVRLPLPLRPDRINRFRLRLEGGGPEAPAVFRVTRAGGKPPSHGKSAPHGSQPDVVGDGLLLGRNWHGLEGVHQPPLFRWVDNDAEIDVVSPGVATALRLEVEPGPGMAGRPCVLSVADGEGRRLGEQTVVGRAVVAFPLPPGEDGATLRLSCAGGGEHIPSDPRVLNFRVFRVETITEGGRP